VLIQVVIPTVDRPSGLLRALKSVVAQQVPFASVGILVIDNSRDGHQKLGVLDAFQAFDEDIAARYIHEPRSGVSFARNRGVAESTAEYVAFLDDDEEPVDQHWLANLTRPLIETGADASFGPVRPVFEAGADPSDSVKRLFTRDLALNEAQTVVGAIDKLGTGNSCFSRKVCFGGQFAQFQEDLNYTGGEDIDFLRRLCAKKKRLVWAPGAPVVEFVSADRITKEYLKNLRFRQGQQRVYLRISSPPKNYLAVMFWMAVGAAQTIGALASRLLFEVVGADDNLEKYQLQLWGGLGKIFWQRRFRRNFYGDRSDPADSSR
jgi:succinoglycan biosynthesis protein ExoM